MKKRSIVKKKEIINGESYTNVYVGTMQVSTNGVKSNKLILLSVYVQEWGGGWVHTTMLGTSNGKEELLVGLKDINGDEYMLRIEERYATINHNFRLTDSEGETETYSEKLEGRYSTAAIIKYLKQLPRALPHQLKKRKRS